MGTSERFIEFLNENEVKDEFEKKVTKEIGKYFDKFTLIDYLRGGYPEWYISGAFVMSDKWQKLDKKWRNSYTNTSITE